MKVLDVVVLLTRVDGFQCPGCSCDGRVSGLEPYPTPGPPVCRGAAEGLLLTRAKADYSPGLCATG